MQTLPRKEPSTTTCLPAESVIPMRCRTTCTLPTARRTFTLRVPLCAVESMKENG
jgi:hypothetical protein